PAFGHPSWPGGEFFFTAKWIRTRSDNEGGRRLKLRTYHSQSYPDSEARAVCLAWLHAAARAALLSGVDTADFQACAIESIDAFNVVNEAIGVWANKQLLILRI